MAKTVLFVEDDGATREGILQVLSANGYRAVGADSVAAGRQRFTADEPDLVLVDVGLPDGSGIELCTWIRAHKTRARTPIIMLTARGEYELKFAGFKAGADQYLIKPLPPHELLLWVEALLRRVDFGDGEALRTASCEIDATAHIVKFKGHEITDLTTKEFDLLYVLVKERPKVLSRKYFLSKVWHTVAQDHLVDSHLYNLRKKLPQELSDKIQAVPGKGFRFLD